jgi:hypothetical protein
MSYLKPAGDAVASAFRAIGGIFESMATLCETAGSWVRTDSIPLDPDTVPVLTFRSVVEWMTYNRPQDSRVAKVALLQESQGESIKIVTVFLDSANMPVIGPNGIPYGRAQRAQRIDQELSDFFGQRSIVLFE